MRIKYCPPLKCKCSWETETLNQLCMTWWKIFRQQHCCAINEVVWWSRGERERDGPTETDRDRRVRPTKTGRDRRVRPKCFSGQNCIEDPVDWAADYCNHLVGLFLWSHWERRTHVLTLTFQQCFLIGSIFQSVPWEGWNKVSNSGSLQSESMKRWFKGQWWGGA